MPFQLANHVPRTNVMKGFISLLYAWSQPSGKCVWENPKEGTNGFWEWRDDTVLNSIPLKLAGRTIKARWYNYIENLVKIIITNWMFLFNSLLVQRGQQNMKRLFNSTSTIVLFYLNCNSFKYCTIHNIFQHLTQTVHLYSNN